MTGVQTCALPICYHSAQGLHYQIEAMRHAYVDRNSYLGDPDFVKNPIAHLLDKDYAAKLRAAIEPQKAGDSQAIKPGVSPHEGKTPRTIPSSTSGATRCR